MESSQQPAQRPSTLRTITSVFAGLLACVLTILFFLFIAWAIFAYFANAFGFEGGGSLALGIDIVCVAPLALIAAPFMGVLTGRFAHKALARAATTRGSHAEKSTNLAIFSIAGISVILVTLVFVTYQVLPLIPNQEREALAKLDLYLTWKSPCHKAAVVCHGGPLSAHVTEFRGGPFFSPKSIPPEINQLSRLEVLDLSRGEINDIPPELSQLSRLKVLDLSRNQLNRIPPELGALSSLRELDLSKNQLSGAIPPELGNLSNLYRLDLRNNQLTTIPPELGNLSNLQYLALADNQLSGNIPPELGALSSLRELNLSKNQLSGAIPPELGNLSNLQYLDLPGNQLNGNIPPELGNLSNLRWLYLSNNQFSGSLPLEMSALSRLNIFTFSDTNLCEPTDAAFQEWLSGIEDLARTGVACP
ncbi:MAG: leucine-rich repeat domain-containing protein [Chloroflexota bacterium]